MYPQVQVSLDAKGVGFLELKLPAVMSCLVWVLGTEHRSSKPSRKYT